MKNVLIIIMVMQRTPIHHPKIEPFHVLNTHTRTHSLLPVTVTHCTSLNYMELKNAKHPPCSDQILETSPKRGVKMAAISQAIAHSKSSKAHVLVLPYPGQGHINPMLQFAKRLASRGPKATLVTTRFIVNSTKAQSGPVQIKPISDGFDQVGFTGAATLDGYLARLEDIGSKTLADLIEEESYSTRPFTCIVYDTYVPWGLDVAKRVGLTAVAFSTQSCVVSAVYCYVNRGLVQVPRVGSSVSVAGSVPLAVSDFPSFAVDNGSYPTLSKLALEQFRLGKADWVLFNSFDELEGKVMTSLNEHWRARAIGPTVPLSLVDDEQSSNYGMNLIQSSDSDKCKKWLESKPPSSVIYISFGSFATLPCHQVSALASALLSTKKPFLWIIRSSEQHKLPKNFVYDNKQGIILSWCQQLAVLAHKSIGCFVTHCGWNSTLEALSRGVPMVAMPQWTDQPTNAKYVEDFWRVGVRARAREGFIDDFEIERCVQEVMEGERSGEMRENAGRWKAAVEAAVREGGSSNQGLEEFVEFLNGVCGGSDNLVN